MKAIMQLSSKLRSFVWYSNVSQRIEFSVEDSSTGLPVDLTNFYAEFQVRQAPGEPLLVKSSTSNGSLSASSTGIVSGNIHYSVVKQLPESCCYDVFIINSVTNEVFKVCEGLILVEQSITTLDEETPVISGGSSGSSGGSGTGGSSGGSSGGSGAIDLVQVQSLTRNDTTTINYNDVTIFPMFALPANAEVTLLSVVITDPFDQQPDISFGIDDNPEQLLGVGFVDYTSPAGTTFEFSSYIAPINREEQIYAYMSINGSTKGQFRVLVNYSIPE